MSKKLEDGWQIGFPVAGCFILFLIGAVLKGCEIINWSWWIITAPLIFIGVVTIYMIFQLILGFNGRVAKNIEKYEVKLKLVNVIHSRKFG